MNRRRSLLARRRSGQVAVLVTIVALVAPGTAGAHIRSSVVAVDYRTSVRQPSASRVTARIFESDLALRLTVAAGHRAIVFGYVGEPFLRVDSDGTAVNVASPTAASTGLLNGTQRRTQAVRWEAKSNRRSVTWHDARLRGLPSGVERGHWAVPLAIDGGRVRLEGEIWRVHAPSLWPWLSLGALLAATAALVLLAHGSSWLPRVTLTLAVLAAAATITTETGFALGRYASAARWAEAGYMIVFAAIGLGVLVLGSATARVAAGTALGVLALFVGLTKVSVLIKGVVLSALPATLARSAVVVAIGAGTGAALVGAFLIFSAIAPGKRPRPKASDWH